MSERADRRIDDEARWSESMRRAQAGDRGAYERLMAELASAIEGYLRARFGNDCASDFCEDCVQESLIAIHRARHTYDPRRSFRPWLFTIVRHKAIDLLRRQRVQRHSAPVEADEEHAGVQVEPVDPSHGLDAATLLEGLGPKHREALVLTKLDGYSLDEAAARAGVSVPAMKTRVHRAIRAVQKSLRAEELR